MKGNVHDISVNYNAIDRYVTPNIHKYLLVKNNIKMFGIIKQVFVRLLPSIVNTSNHTKCISLKNQKFKIQPTLITLRPYEYGQGLRYYLLAVNLDRCMGSWYTLNDLSTRLRAPEKTEDLNLNVFNMITRTNQSKALTKGINLCRCECQFDSRKYNSN